MCIFTVVSHGKAIRRSLGQLGQFIKIGCEQLRYELVSYLTVVPLLLFLFIVIYLGIFSGIEGFAVRNPGIINPWTFLAFSLCHYVVALVIAPAQKPALRYFSACAGLGRAEVGSLQRVSFIARNWHIPFVDLLLFLPIAARWKAFARGVSFPLELCFFFAYSLAALIGFSSLAFWLKKRHPGSEAPKAARFRKKMGHKLSFLAASLIKRGEAIFTAAIVVFLELAVAKDLIQHPSSLVSGDMSYPQRWLLFYSLCVSILVQAILLESYRSPKDYYRLFPLSFFKYTKAVFSPMLVACLIVMMPLLCCMVFYCPTKLIVALPLLAALSFLSFAIAQWREANRVAVAIALFSGSIALSVLTVFSPFASLGIAMIAATLVIPGSRRHFLFDEVVQ
jgi:hypothetical protein